MAKCGLCGVDVTFDIVQHYVPDFEGRKHRVCKQCVTRAQGKALKYDAASGKIVIVETSDIEVRKKCNVCGNVFCYNPVDLDNNRKKQSQAVWSAVGSLGGAMSGHYAASAINQSNANQAMNGIVDYNKCPKCGSMDLRVISKEELAAEMNYTRPQQTAAPQISVADELKKYKELLDLGVITQDEFNEKKNELLHGQAPVVQPTLPVTPNVPQETTVPAEIVQDKAPESKKMQPYRGLLIVSIVSFVLVLLSFLLTILTISLTLGDYLYISGDKFLIALIVPCICLFMSFYAQKQPELLKPAAIISLVFVLLQIACVIIWGSAVKANDLIRFISKYINGAGLLSSFRAFKINYAHVGLSAKITTMNLLGVFQGLCAIAANVCVTITLFLAKKKIK